jgi:hypothetical protein
VRVGRRWIAEFNGARGERWNSPRAAARAVAQHRSGIAAWDDKRLPAPADPLDWRPLGEDL